MYIDKQRHLVANCYNYALNTTKKYIQVYKNHIHKYIVLAHQAVHVVKSKSQTD